MQTEAQSSRATNPWRASGKEFVQPESKVGEQKHSQVTVHPRVQTGLVSRSGFQEVVSIGNRYTRQTTEGLASRAVGPKR